MMTTRMRLQSTTQGQLRGTFSLVRMHSHTQVLSKSYAHSQGQSTLHEDLSQGRALNDSTHTRNTHPTMSFHPATRLTMTRPYEPVSPHFFLLQLLSEDCRSLVSLVLHRP